MEKTKTKYTFINERKVENLKQRLVKRIPNKIFTKNEGILPRWKIGNSKANTEAKSETKKKWRPLIFKTRAVVLKIIKSMNRFSISTYSITISIFPRYKHDIISLNLKSLKKITKRGIFTLFLSKKALYHKK